MIGLRERLRAATRRQHAEIERALDLTCETLTLQDYVGYLDATWSYYVAVERKLIAFANDRALRSLRLAERRKTPWLEDDLAYFGSTHMTPSARRSCHQTPVIQHRAEAAGCAYVLEGAVLGGTTLQLQFHRRWTLAPGRGGTFLEGYGPRTGSMWRDFTAALNELPFDEREREVCIQAARETFLTLKAWHAGCKAIA